MQGNDSILRLGMAAGTGMGMDEVELIGEWGGRKPRGGETEAGEGVGVETDVEAGVSSMKSTAKCFFPIGTGDNWTLNEGLSNPPPKTDIEDEGHAVCCECWSLV